MKNTQIIKKILKSTNKYYYDLTSKFKEKIYDNIWIEPVAEDVGGFLGVGLALWYLDHNKVNKEEKKEEVNLNKMVQNFFSDNKQLIFNLIQILFCNLS